MSVEERLNEEKRLQKVWDSLTITNDFLFSKTMCDKELCMEFTETLLGIKLGDIRELQREKSIKINMDAKGIRLDVYFRDSDQLFNIELQVAKEIDLKKRSRYYQSMMDLDCLEAGEKYHILPKSYVVFICTKDPFGGGLPCYSYENKCNETGDSLDDGTYKIFFNTTAYKDAKGENLKALLKYFNGELTEDALVQKINKRVLEIKQSTEWRMEFMKWQLDMNDQYEKGKLEGRLEGKLEGVEIGVEKGKLEEKFAIAKGLLDILDNAMIALKTGLTLSQVEQLRTGN